MYLHEKRWHNMFRDLELLDFARPWQDILTKKGVLFTGKTLFRQHELSVETATTTSFKYSATGEYSDRKK